VLDGKPFQSTQEGKRYLVLKIKQELNLISDLKCQTKFLLQEKFKKKGKTIQPITWSADFTYLEKRKEVAEDVKPWNKKNKKFIIEPDTRLKHKMFEYLYPEIKLLLVI
jgi:hypothetical protein